MNPFKTILSVAILLLLSAVSYAQAPPQGINYQTVIRDNGGTIIPNQTIGFQFSILKNSAMGSAVYVETQSTTTNSQGVADLVIGFGVPVLGPLSAVQWENDNYFLQVDVDVAGGTNYQTIGTSQLLSVPYAFHAQTASELNIEGNTNDILAYNGSEWSPNTLSVNNNGGNLSHNNMQPSLGLTYIIALQGVFPSPSRSANRSLDPFLAEIILFGGNFAPQGWAKCEGQLLSISQYSALFSILGTQYGGDGETTFALPDLRGRVPVGQGNGPGLTPRSNGQKFGSETETLNVNQMPSHNHGTTLTDTSRDGQ